MGKLLKSSEKINPLSLAVITLLLFIPLYPKFPLFSVPGTYVAIRIEDFLVAGVVLFWFLGQLRQGFPFWREKVSRLILLYWGVGALSLISALLITKNITPHLALFHFFRRLEYMSLFFVALASLKTVRNVKSYSLTLLLATVGVVIYGLGQKFFSWPVVSTMNVEFSKGMLLQLTEWARVNSTFAGHYDLAAFLVIVLALTAGLVVGLKPLVSKVLIIFVGLFAFYLLILTASRVSFAAYLIAITLTLLGLKKHWWLGPVLAFSLVGMLLSSEISQRYALTFNVDLSFLSNKVRFFPKPAEETKPIMPTPPPKMVEKVRKKKTSGVRKPVFRPTPTPTVVATAAAEIERWKPTTEVAVEYSSGIRFHVEWPRAIRAFLKNPFLGTGYSSVTLATDNDYLRALAETGFLGFWAFGLIFLEIARRVVLYLQQAKPGFERAVVVGITGGTIGFFANALFIDVFEASKLAFIFWLLMGILMGIIRLNERRG